MVSSLGEAVFVIDRAGQITFLNPTAEVLTGWTVTTARGRALTQLLPLETAASDRMAETPLDLRLQRLFVGAERRLERDLRLPDRQRPGNYRHWRMSGSPIRLPGGLVAGAVILLHDITTSHTKLRFRK